MEQNSIAFHNRAKELLFSLYKDFKNSAAHLDRQKDENVFQQLQGQYCNLFKQQLQHIARDVMGNAAAGPNTGEINHALSRFIEDYKREMVHMIRSL